MRKYVQYTDIWSAANTLEAFQSTAAQLGLHVSWQKTKAQNLGLGEPISNLSVGGVSVEGITQFTYPGSIQSTTGRCQPDILRLIGIAFTAMHFMSRVWQQPQLQLQTKLHLYQTCILSILL